MRWRTSASYCVDNIPPKLIPTFYDLCAKAGDTFSRVAVVTDIRGGDMFSSLFETLDDLKNEDKHYRILFLDANDYVLINRFKETRRKHPLAENNLGSLEQAAQAGARDFAAGPGEGGLHHRHVVPLPGTVEGAHFQPVFGRFFAALMVHCVSFGFKYGILPRQTWSLMCAAFPIRSISRSSSTSPVGRTGVLLCDEMGADKGDCPALNQPD